jgi:peroxiredoxin Q/BCP
MASTDAPEVNKAFAEKEKADFPMLSDPGLTTAEAYGVLSPPNPNRPDAQRRARRWMFFIGPDGKILHIEKASHTADAGEFLATKLEELGVKKRK